MANNSKTKVVTGTVRLSYANVWEPKSINGGAEKYSVSVIISKDDKKTIDAINAAVDAAIEEGLAKFGGKKPNRRQLSCLCAMVIPSVMMRRMQAVTS